MFEHAPGATDEQRLNLVQLLEDIPGTPREEAVAEWLCSGWWLDQFEYDDESYPGFDWDTFDRVKKFHFRREAEEIVRIIEHVDAGEI
jgi:hypothetical protein